MTAQCSDDPAVSRVWKVHNPNAFAVPFTWYVFGAPINGSPLAWMSYVKQSGSATATASGDTMFASPTVAGPNPAAIVWSSPGPLKVGFWVSLSTTTACANPVRVNPQPGQNVNMVSGTGWPGGDPFLQRQNEPSAAFSTRNALHLVAGANDYRTVDLPFPSVNPDDEEYAGDAWLGLFKSFDGGQTWQSTLLPGYPQDQSSPESAAFRASVGAFGAAADPVVRAGTAGLFYYAGIAFNRPASGTPTEGALFVARLMDLNNKENGDATQSKDPIRYIDAVKVASTSANAFVDKPAMAVDIPRGTSTCTLSVPQGGGLVPQTVPAGNVYVAYSVFATSPSQAATVYLARSSDCGASWSSPVALSTSAQQVSQGAAIAVNPVSGDVYVAWRQFASGLQPNAINIVTITGGTAVGAVNQVISHPSFDSMNPTAATFFDQGTSPGSFRTNAYPAIAADGSGRIYLAWSERQPLAFGDARVLLSSSADGIVWPPGSTVDGDPVTDDVGNAFSRGHQFMPQMTFNGGRLTLLYYDLRLDHTLGLFNAVSGFPTPDAQGRFELETRAKCGLVPPSPCAGETDSAVFTPFIVDTGLTLRRHTLDLRIAQAGPNPTSFTTRRLSQYNFGTRGDETGVSGPSGPEVPYLQQLQVNPPNFPMFQLGTTPFFGDYIDIAGVQFVQSSPGGPWTFNTAPSKAGTQFAVWTSNQDVIPPYDPVQGRVDWTLYTPPRSALNAGNGGNASLFDAGQTVPACEASFAGSRNQNIYGALVTQEFLFSSPQNSKPLSSTLQRAFVVVAQNLTNVNKTFRLVIENQPPGGWASFTGGTNQPLAAPSPVVTNLDLAVAAHSSASRSVFATSSTPSATITVSIAETSGLGQPLVVNGLAGFVNINADASTPALVPPDDVVSGDIATVEVYMPNVTNPNVTNPNVTNPNVTNPNVTNPNVTNSNVINPNVTNPNVTNPNVTNPNVTNPNVTNPDIATPNVTNPNVTNPNVTNPNVTNPNVTNPNVTNPNVTNPNVTNVNPSDAVYTVTNTGNTAAAYRVSLVGTAPAGVTTQLIITKTYKTPAAQNCQVFEQDVELLQANILNPVFTPPGGNLTDPSILDPGLGNPTVALKPQESATITLRAYTDPKTLGTIMSTLVPVVVPQGANTNNPTNTPSAQAAGGTTISPGTAQILTGALPDGLVLVAYSANPVVSGIVGPQAWSVSAGSLPAGLSLNAANGQVTGTPTGAGTFSFTLRVTGGVLSATHDYTVRVVPAMSVGAAALPSGTVGSPYAASLSVSGGLVPIAWSLASGSLPAGLTLSSGGAITGVPLVAGSSLFFARAVDSANPSQAATQSFSIVVNSATPPLLTLSAVPDVSGGQTFSVIAHLEDSMGAPIPGALISIAFGAQPCSAAVLGGSGTNLTNVTGNALFALSIDRGQLGYTLVASAVGLPGVTATTNPFNVEGFCGTTPMTVARKWHTATRLANGKVLVTGGSDGTVALASAELFDPATGSFTATGSMGVPRAFHSATLLADGTVLVVGGGSDFESGTLGSAERYDPGTGLFTPAGGLTGHTRQMHGAVRLNDGRVLVAGGFTNDSGIGGLATAELYDPGTNTFSATSGNMTHDRIGDFTTTLLADGRVLLAGGFRNLVGGPAMDGELFDPVSATFSAAPIPMISRRGKHTAVLQASGQVLLAGGEDDLTFLSSTEYFDPATASFVVSLSSQPVLLTARESHTGTRLSDERFLEAGGQTLVLGVPTPIASAEIYDPVSGTVSATGSLGSARQLHTATPLTDGTVLLAGGSGGSGAVLGTAEVFHPAVYVGQNPAFAGVSISNVQLNGGGNFLFLPGGGALTLDHDYFIFNDPGCPGCIDQIEVGLASGLYQACTYDGIPGVAGVAGHGTTSLTVPASPGRYFVGFDYAQTYFCNQYPAWWSGPPGPSRYMAVVIVP